MKSFLIGSLPFSDITSALDYSFSFSIPTLCSLPKFDQNEFMVDQALRETDNYVYKNHRLVENGKKYEARLRFCSEEEFFKRLEKRPKDDSTYKWQACGPLTLASSLDHHPDENEIIESYIHKLLRTQKSFNKRNTRCIFFIDEPILAFAGDGAYLYKFIQRLRESEEFKSVTIGLHVCSKVSPLLLANLDVDIYSLDLSLYDDEERELLQVSLSEKLVYAPVGSSGEIYEYPAFKEVYVSSSCGHALCPLERMDGILERIKSFETR